MVEYAPRAYANVDIIESVEVDGCTVTVGLRLQPERVSLVTNTYGSKWMATSYGNRILKAKGVAPRRGSNYGRGRSS